MTPVGREYVKSRVGGVGTGRVAGDRVTKLGLALEYMDHRARERDGRISREVGALSRDKVCTRSVVRVR